MYKLIKNNSIKNYLKAILCLLSLIFLNACEDYGCIDADDFGEYEIYTFPVNANRLSEYCEYKKDVSATSQPFGIKQCVSTPATNCLNLSNDDCGEKCEAECYASSEKNFKDLMNNQSITNPIDALGFADPPWVAVGGGNNQLSIEENSQILITAQGTIDLGGASPEKVLSISNADIGNKELNALKSNSNIAQFIGGESLEISFYNSFSNNEGTEVTGATLKFFPNVTEDNSKNAIPTSPIPIDNTFNYYRDFVANGARRILAYSIPLPEGYSQFAEYDFPLDPNPSAWPCEIEDGKLICSNDSKCSSQDTTACDDYYGKSSLKPPAGKMAEFNQKFSQVFNVNNKEKEKTRYKNGTGFIRSNDDRLIGIDVVPQSNYIVNLDLNEVKKGLGSILTFPNPTKDYAVVFVKSKLDSSGAECNIGATDIQYSITKTNASTRASDTKDYPINPISSSDLANNTSSEVINKEDLSTVSVKKVLLSSTTFNTNCKLDAYLYEFHELQFEQSGYIEFGIADQASGSDPTKKSISLLSAASCNLSFKIFHEDNDDEDEFANFTYPVSASVPSKKVGESGVEHKVLLNSTSPTIACSSSCVNNPKKYFIRKGQKLSFHPLSWKGNWTPNPGSIDSPTVNVNCGVGFYVKFTPRPAVFCPDFKVKEYINRNQDSDATNNCTSKIEAGGERVYCEIDPSKCYDNLKPDPANPASKTNNDLFCPRECIPTKFSSCSSFSPPPAGASSNLATLNTTLTSKEIYSITDAPLVSSIPNCEPTEPVYKCYSEGSQAAGSKYLNPEYGGICPQQKCKSYTAMALLDPYKSMKLNDGITALAAATDEGNSEDSKMNQNRCNNCLNQLKKDAQKKYFQDTLSGADLQQCYNLENYEGTVRALQDHIIKIKNLVGLAGGITADDRKAKAAYLLLNNKTIQNYDATTLPDTNGKDNFKRKGLEKLGSFDGNFGNLYPVKYLKNVTVAGADLPLYSTDAPIIVASPSYIKFIILDDVTIPASTATTLPDYFEQKTLPGVTIQPLKIKINNKDSYSNGDKLTVAICKENSSAGNTCGAFQNLVNESNLSNPLKITEYIPASDELDSSNNYKFNEFGQLVRITPDQSSPSDCNVDGLRPFIGANFLCFNDEANTNNDNPSHDNRYRIAFKIFDNQTVGNCNESSTNTGTYQDCTQPTPPNTTPACNRYKSINLKWSGLSADSGYCPASVGDCTKKFICNDSPYFNNTGHYNVAVKIKRGSKVKVANFINSIISPILEEVDGVNKIENTAFEIGSNEYNLVYNAITNLPFYANVANQNYFGVNGLNLNTLDISPFKAIDDKIVDGVIEFGDDLDLNIDEYTTLKLDPNKVNPDVCKNRCFISYIYLATFSSTSYKQPYTYIKCPLRSHRQQTMERIRAQCQGKAFCNIEVYSREELTRLYKIDIGAGTEVSADSVSLNSEKTDDNCKKKSLSVHYLYSLSDQTFHKENQIKRLYNIILLNPVYQSFLTLSVVLMFSFYGMGFLMGVSELKQSEIIDRLVKVGIIYLFTNPSFGWVWFDKFFVTFFKNGTDFLTFLMASFFDETGQVESALLANDFSNKSIIFGGTDRVIALFINNDVIHKKILSLLFYKFFGILYTMIIYYSAITYVYAISNAVLIYLTSQFFISILFSVGPFFFVFILFKQTKTFFDNWINSLIGFALQQIFLIFTLSLFNSFLYLIIKLTLGYRICWDSVWEINILSSKISLLSFWTPQEAPAYISNTMDPTTSGSPSGIPTLPKLLSLWSLCVIMKSFLGSITDLVATLSGGVSATELGTGISASMNKAIGDVKQKVAKAYNKSGLKVMERLDQKVFDSGTLAKSARKKAAAADDQNRNLKAKMLNDGNKAVSDYKTNKSEEFSKLSEAEKREKLTKIKKEAMINTAKQAGKGDKSIEKLMSDTKGSSYKGDNVFGYAASHAMDYLRNNKTSMNAKAASVDTGMSKSEMKTTLKNLDGPEKRQDFLNSIKEGKIQQKESGITLGSRTKKSLKELGGGATNSAKNIYDREFEKAAGSLYGGIAKSFNTATKGDISKEERNIAVKQLEKSGEISKQTYESKSTSGGGAMKNINNAIDNVAGNARASLAKRSPEEENKIIAKVQENRLAQSFDKGSNMSGKNIDKLESFAKYLNKKDNKGDVEDRVKEKEDTKKPNEQNVEKINQEINTNAVNKLEGQKRDNDLAIGNASIKLASSKETLGNTQKAIDGNDDHKRMDALKSKIDKGENVTSQDRKDFKELSEKDGGKVGREFEDKVKARSNASSEVAKDEANLKNLEIKGAKIDTALTEARSKQGSNAADSVTVGDATPSPDGAGGDATPPPDGGTPPATGGTPSPAGGE